jgi:hypothetical protein
LCFEKVLQRYKLFFDGSWEMGDGIGEKNLKL